MVALKISSGPSAGSGGGSLYSGRRIPSSQVKNLLRVPQQRAPAHCMCPSLACSSCFSPPTESGGLHVAPASISECSMAQKSLDCGSWGHSVMWLSYFSGPPQCCHIQPHQSIFCAHARLLSVHPNITRSRPSACTCFTHPHAVPPRMPVPTGTPKVSPCHAAFVPRARAPNRRPPAHASVCPSHLP